MSFVFFAKSPKQELNGLISLFICLSYSWIALLLLKHLSWFWMVIMQLCLAKADVTFQRNTSLSANGHLPPYKCQCTLKINLSICIYCTYTYKGNIKWIGKSFGLDGIKYVLPKCIGFLWLICSKNKYGKCHSILTFLMSFSIFGVTPFLSFPFS